MYQRWLPDVFLFIGFVEKHRENGGKSLKIGTHVLDMPYDQKKMTGIWKFSYECQYLNV